jgi:hypothetical protein
MWRGIRGLMGADEESASFLYVAIRHHAETAVILRDFSFPLFRIIRYNAPPTAF